MDASDVLTRLCSSIPAVRSRAVDSLCWHLRIYPERALDLLSDTHVRALCAVVNESTDNGEKHRICGKIREISACLREDNAQRIILETCCDEQDACDGVNSHNVSGTAPAHAHTASHTDDERPEIDEIVDEIVRLQSLEAAGLLHCGGAGGRPIDTHLPSSDPDPRCVRVDGGSHSYLPELSAAHAAAWVPAFSPTLSAFQTAISALHAKDRVSHEEIAGVCDALSAAISVVLDTYPGFWLAHPRMLALCMSSVYILPDNPADASVRYHAVQLMRVLLERVVAAHAAALEHYVGIESDGAVLATDKHGHRALSIFTFAGLCARHAIAAFSQSRDNVACAAALAHDALAVILSSNGANSGYARWLQVFSMQMAICSIEEAYAWRSRACCESVPFVAPGDALALIQASELARRQAGRDIEAAALLRIARHVVLHADGDGFWGNGPRINTDNALGDGTYSGDDSTSSHTGLRSTLAMPAVRAIRASHTRRARLVSTKNAERIAVEAASGDSVQFGPALWAAVDQSASETVCGDQGSRQPLYRVLPWIDVAREQAKSLAGRISELISCITNACAPGRANNAPASDWMEPDIARALVCMQQACLRVERSAWHSWLCDLWHRALHGDATRFQEEALTGLLLQPDAALRLLAVTAGSTVIARTFPSIMHTNKSNDILHVLLQIAVADEDARLRDSATAIVGSMTTRLHLESQLPWQRACTVAWRQTTPSVAGTSTSQDCHALSIRHSVMQDLLDRDAEICDAISQVPHGMEATGAHIYGVPTYCLKPGAIATACKLVPPALFFPSQDFAAPKSDAWPPATSSQDTDAQGALGAAQDSHDPDIRERAVMMLCNVVVNGASSLSSGITSKITEYAVDLLRTPERSVPLAALLLLHACVSMSETARGALCNSHADILVVLLRMALHARVEWVPLGRCNPALTTASSQPGEALTSTRILALRILCRALFTFDAVSDEYTAVPLASARSCTAYVPVVLFNSTTWVRMQSIADGNEKTRLAPAWVIPSSTALGWQRALQFKPLVLEWTHQLLGTPDQHADGDALQAHLHRQRTLCKPRVALVHHNIGFSELHGVPADDSEKLLVEAADALGDTVQNDSFPVWTATASAAMLAWMRHLSRHAITPVSLARVARLVVAVADRIGSYADAPLRHPLLVSSLLRCGALVHAHETEAGSAQHESLVAVVGTAVRAMKPHHIADSDEWALSFLRSSALRTLSCLCLCSRRSAESASLAAIVSRAAVLPRGSCEDWWLATLLVLQDDSMREPRLAARTTPTVAEVLGTQCGLGQDDNAEAYLALLLALWRQRRELSSGAAITLAAKAPSLLRLAVQPLPNGRLAVWRVTRAVLALAFMASCGELKSLSIETLLQWSNMCISAVAGVETGHPSLPACLHLQACVAVREALLNVIDQLLCLGRECQAHRPFLAHSEVSSRVVHWLCAAEAGVPGGHDGLHLTGELVRCIANELQGITTDVTAELVAALRRAMSALAEKLRDDCGARSPLPATALAEVSRACTVLHAMCSTVLAYDALRIMTETGVPRALLALLQRSADLCKDGDAVYLSTQLLRANDAAGELDNFVQAAATVYQLHRESPSAQLPPPAHELIITVAERAVAAGHSWFALMQRMAADCAAGLSDIAEGPVADGVRSAPKQYARRVQWHLACQNACSLLKILAVAASANDPARKQLEVQPGRAVVGACRAALSMFSGRHVHPGLKEVAAQILCDAFLFLGRVANQEDDAALHGLAHWPGLVACLADAIGADTNLAAEPAVETAALNVITRLASRPGNDVIWLHNDHLLGCALASVLHANAQARAAAVRCCAVMVTVSSRIRRIVAARLSTLHAMSLRQMLDASLDGGASGLHVEAATRTAAELLLRCSEGK